LQVGCRESLLPLVLLMRIFAFILSLYIAALSLVPCADGMPQSSVENDIELLLSDHEHNHSDHKDDCTPFCACLCCGSIVAMPHDQTPSQSIIEISTHYQFHYTFDYALDYIEGVWHPPSIS